MDKKDISGNSGTAFALIQRSLEDASRDRVGHALASAIRKFRRKIESITNGKKGKAFERYLKGCLILLCHFARKQHTATLGARGLFTSCSRSTMKRALSPTFDKTKPPEKQMEKQIKTHYIKCL